jgi:hypothetical protein
LIYVYFFIDVVASQDVSLATRVAIDIYFEDTSEEVDGGVAARLYALDGHHGFGVDLGR